MTKHLILFILLIHTFTSNCLASHAAGADLSYEFIERTVDNKIKLLVTYAFYRDCAGIEPDPVMILTLEGGACTQQVGLQRVLPWVEVSSTCKSEKSFCQGGNIIGYERHIYKGEVEFEESCGDIAMTVSVEARNQVITTVDSSEYKFLNVTATYNQSVGLNNTSVRFDNPPVAFLCTESSTCINVGAFDADGDELRYSLVSPQDQNGDIEYYGSYTFQNPIDGNISVNETTGDICLSPTTQMVTIMAILVEEFRNGVLVGSTVRDIQLTIYAACNNVIPVMLGFDGKLANENNTTKAICLNEDNVFYISAFDANLQNDLFFTVPEFVYQYASLEQEPENNRVKLTVNIPSEYVGGDICFAVNVNDDHCPIIGQTTQTYCFTIHRDIPEFPNVFTPNNDGVYDFFGLLKPINPDISFDLKIFNRWGKQVYTTNDSSFKWSGLGGSGLSSNESVYYYTCTTGIDCSSRKKSGYVYLLR